MSETLRGRELVNPNIMQAAPEVNQNSVFIIIPPACVCIVHFLYLSLSVC